MEAKISKLELLRAILNEDEQDNPANSISTFTTRVESRISVTMRQIIQDTKESLLQMYNTSLHQAALLSQYLEQ